MRLVWEEIVGYAGNIIHPMTFVDDGVVSALFLVVRPPLRKAPPF